MQDLYTRILTNFLNYRKVYFLCTCQFNISNKTFEFSHIQYTFSKVYPFWDTVYIYCDYAIKLFMGDAVP